MRYLITFLITLTLFSCSDSQNEKINDLEREINTLRARVSSSEFEIEFTLPRRINEHRNALETLILKECNYIIKDGVVGYEISFEGYVWCTGKILNKDGDVVNILKKKLE